MLTSALRSGGLATTSVAEATPSRSPGVSSTAFRAQPPNLRFAPLMDMDFAVSCPLVRRWRLVSGFCPSTRTFVPCFLQTPPRGGSPCIITRPYLHQVGRRTFTSGLLSMPSTQRSRQGAEDAPRHGTRDVRTGRVARLQYWQGLAFSCIVSRSMDCREDRISEPPAFASKRKVRT